MITLLFALYGYLNGSVLYARVFAKLFGKGDIVLCSNDKNPGTSNAFKYGGFWCGVLTLAFDILKGFVPVFLFMLFLKTHNRALPFGAGLVMVSPVLGHAFPLFFGFNGGKGIAATFGSLLGLIPIWQPVAVLALFFIFFSVILKISPHYQRTVVAYFCSALGIASLNGCKTVAIGFLIITATVYIRMFLSNEQREKVRVEFLWKH